MLSSVLPEHTHSPRLIIWIIPNVQQEIALYEFTESPRKKILSDEDNISQIRNLKLND